MKCKPSIAKLQHLHIQNMGWAPPRTLFLSHGNTLTHPLQLHINIIKLSKLLSKSDVVYAKYMTFKLPKFSMW